MEGVSPFTREEARLDAEKGVVDRQMLLAGLAKNQAAAHLDGAATEAMRRNRARVEFGQFVERTIPYKLEDWQHLLCERLSKLPHQTGQRLLIHGPPQYGKPNHENALVRVGDGSYRPLREIKVGDFVIAHSGQARRVERVWIQGALPCVEITTDKGRVTAAALDHPFATPLGWVQAGQLQAGGFVLAMRADKSLEADEIVSVRDVGELPCRCLTVEVDHTFTVNDLVVHNSLLLSQRFPAWMLGVNPDLRVRLACYNQTHAKRFSDTNIQLMKDPDFLNVFPDAGTRLPNKVAKQEWSTRRRIEIRDANPSFKALGLGSGFTGMGADCLTGETLIDTAEGCLRIEELCQMETPPPVRSWNHKAGDFAWCRVLAARALPCPGICEVVTRGGRLVRCTPDHRFFARGRGYVAARDLRAGDGLVLSDGLCAWDEVASVESVSEGTTVYDIQVTDCENFFANGVLVHNCAIIDDPYKNRAEAFSDVINENIWLWYTTVLLSRCNPSTNIIVMFHRWKDFDLAGRLIEQGGWEMFRFAAIGDGADDDPMKRKKGVILSNRYPLAYLEHVRQVQGELDFLALYQGKPTNAAGTIFKAHHLLPVGEDGSCATDDNVQFWPFPSWARVRDAVLSADTALSKRQQADMSAIGLFFRADDGYDYVYPLVLRRIDVDGVVREMCVAWARWRVELGPVLRGFALEEGAAGTPAAQGALALVTRAQKRPSEEDYKLDALGKRKEARHRSAAEREAMERVSATYKPGESWTDVEWEAVRAAPPLQLATYRPGTLEKGGKGDIIARANQITPRVGNRRVRVCADGGNWAVARAWLGQLLALPAGAHDDAVQATIEGVLALGGDADDAPNGDRPNDEAMKDVFG